MDEETLFALSGIAESIDGWAPRTIKLWFTKPNLILASGRRPARAAVCPRLGRDLGSRSADQNRCGLVGRRPRLDVVMVDRNRDIRLWIIGRDGALRDMERDCRQVAHDTFARFRSGIGRDRNVDEIAMLQPAAGEVAFVDEHDVAPPRNSAIAIIQAVDRCVVLIMTSDGRERESITIAPSRIFIDAGMDEEIGLLRRRPLLALRCGNVEPKPTLLLDARSDNHGLRKNCLDGAFRIAHRDGKIAAKTDQCLRAPIQDRLDGFDRVVALVAWWLESEGAGQSVQKRITRNLGNADRAIPLHIRVAA